MRAPNEIDFWRGFALLTIFVNHVPGLYFERFTYRNVSLSDSAELFVFLAGWAMRKLIDGPVASLSAGALVFRLESRALHVYVAQTVITEIAIALLAASALLFDAPFLLDWHNASAVFNDPVRAHVGLVLLTHQLGYFNILPLYVVLMFAAPLIALTHRFAPRLLLPISFTIYAFALITGVNLPTWPVEGTWFFNPLCWQLIYCLGFALGGEDGLGAFARRHRRVLWFVALPIILVGAVVALMNFSPNPIAAPSPKLVFMFDKTFLSPARLIHSLALTAFFAGSFVTIRQALPLLAKYLSMLGRNSLNVFCAASLLSLICQIFRFVYGGHIATDALIVILGVSVMGVVAWASEWRGRLSANPPKRVPSP
ncbi:OpgC family protein [Methylocella tundrae]|uniref:OpgC protein n=1 Tax=Methylocella tundrae TaxID=227605 RepID=A0A4U8Z5A8_METTU|nr:OpgC domain-containing protein [Methylocella tundrae]WPP04376.1 OpgC domain-containing protein [Methylocella tundrae]VFU10726.1 OpgC protein [Methylocella tundrae]